MLTHFGNFLCSFRKKGQFKTELSLWRTALAQGFYLCYNKKKSLLEELWLLKYILTFFISMVPIIELRGAVPYATAAGISYWVALPLCVVANMLPVPFIYFFARKTLVWGSDKKYIGKFFRFCLEKGERAGQKLAKTAGRKGLFFAVMIFVGIPLPGTGAWTGTLGASFLNMGFKSTVVAVSLGVIMAGAIMALVSTLGLHIFGL